MAKEKILVVDDEERIVGIVRAYLEKDGYDVVSAGDGIQALALARQELPDLIVLDLMLPGLSGLDVCRAVRIDSRVPIIMLTARDEDTDKIIGLELGADDYVTKPFNPRELLARVHAVLRRNAPDLAPVERIVSGDLSIDVDRHQVRLAGRDVALTPSEFSLLETLARQPGRVFSRLQLVEAMQGEAYEGYERAVDSHVKNLRRKIEADPRNPRYVLTVFGLGYKFSDSPHA
jgi:two-component system, OmpR family, alkaline phosphatase synthesis response regulator PhoP